MFNFFKSDVAKPKTLGQRGEEFAQEQYKKRGFEILAANFFNTTGKRLGEIDFIARNKSHLVFVEVKTRQFGGSKFGSGAEAVNVFKQKKILKAAKIYLQKNPKLQSLVPQIDICSVDFKEFDKPQFSAIIISNAVEDESI